jgi:hypothetical protein
VVALLLGLRVVFLDRPAAALGARFLLAGGALALLAGWTLLSGTWSGAAARALTEFDRVVLYLLGFVLLGTLGRSPERLRWAVRGLAAAAFVVCVCGLVTRFAPDVWPIDPAVQPGRLSYPMGYWNALGLLAAIGIILAFATTSDERETPLVRVLSAAMLPVLGAALLLTFSRGAIAVGVVGLVVLIVVGRPRALLGGLLVAVPTVGLAVAAAYRADLLATDHPATAAAIAQGHDTAFVIVVCVVLAAMSRAALLGLDRWTMQTTVPARPSVVRAVAGLVVAAAVAVLLATGVPSAVGRQYDSFVTGGELTGGDDVRGRLTEASNNGRIVLWRVGLDAFQREPLHGEGAGTFPVAWDLHRPVSYQAEDAHSLYVEILGELGIVGLGLVSIAILLVLGGFAARARGPDRVVGAALFASGLAWTLHAGLDWDWEMPAITFWFFAAGGLALARSSDVVACVRAPTLGGVAMALVCVMLAWPAAQLFRSDRSLRASARAFAAGRCPTAIDQALDARDALSIRPEPFIVLGYCDVRLGRTDLALRAMHDAVRKDPANWEGYYGLALAHAAAGQDPRPSLQQARRRNPRAGILVRTRQLLGDDPAGWAKLSARAELPVD